MACLGLNSQELFHQRA
ncbi:hypothetical protein D039_5254A, partial [Vibrio parahaemolyticus EKP-028]